MSFREGGRLALGLLYSPAMRTIACAALGFALVLAACSDPTGPVSAVGDTVYTSHMQKLVLEGRGGAFTAEQERDPACNPWTFGGITFRFTVTTADHQLAWEYCAVDGTGSTPVYTPTHGARVLTDAEWSSLQPALRGLVVVAPGSCGADAERLAVIVTTSASTDEYGDGFYGCDNTGTVLLSFDGLSAAEAAFQMLAK